MVMTHAEIAADYRNARKPGPGKIKALAVVNGCSEQKIMDILDAEGVDYTAVRKPRKERTKITPEIEARMLELYNGGRIDQEVADEVEVSRSAVASWRKRKGLAARPRRMGENAQEEALETAPETASEVGQEPVPEISTAAREAPEAELSADTLDGLEVYADIETILSAVPLGSSRLTRVTAAELVVRMLDEYAQRRLGLGLGQAPEVGV